MRELLDWPIIGNIIELLNWLTITIPFIVSFGAKEATFGKTHSQTLSWLAAVTVFVGFIIGLYFLYGIAGFPLWMRWFHV